jgi:hypothetical protein
LFKTATLPIEEDSTSSNAFDGGVNGAAGVNESWRDFWKDSLSFGAPLGGDRLTLKEDNGSVTGPETAESKSKSSRGGAEVSVV